jgi:hypothetical protein
LIRSKRHARALCDESLGKGSFVGNCCPEIPVLCWHSKLLAAKLRGNSAAKR